ALEHLGERLGISEGVTGSLFAAVGTALPETVVPLVALIGLSATPAGAEIAAGAILGAPLMLSTLSICLMGLSVVFSRGLRGALTPEMTGLTRDLNTFLLAFGLAVAALWVPPDWQGVRSTLVVLLVLIYFFYILLTIRASAPLVLEGHGTEAHHALFLSRLGLPDRWGTILLQLLMGLGLLVSGAQGFVQALAAGAGALGLSTLVLALLIVPIATELPEKVNSILWIRRGKDTLAFGNITGAMVFQGTLLPAIGIAFTTWEPRPAIMTGLFVTLLAAIWLRVLVARRRLRLWHLLFNGGLYLGYLVLALQSLSEI
ncbi:MAG: sodium:calcium antiporter, partial [Pseudomonadota bacterium]